MDDSSPPSPEEFEINLQAFMQEVFNAHNNYRTLHGCPPLQWSEELAGSALSWAEKLAERGFLQYSENPTLGENIYVLSLDDGPLTGEDVVNEWYKEIQNYNFQRPGWKRGTHHVSQILWKSTTEMGVGMAKIQDQNKGFIVIHYRPAGNNNMPGEFERNVLPPSKNNTPVKIMRHLSDEVNQNTNYSMFHRNHYNGDENQISHL